MEKRQKFAFRKNLELKPTGPAITVEAASKTDIGRVREGNEDAMCVIDLHNGQSPREVGSRGVLMCVCDGMGGAAAGEVASRVAIDTVRARMLRGARLELPLKSHAARLVYAVVEANATVHERSFERELRGMGTTCTAALAVGDQLLVAQVGDSRAYVLRNQELVQVTRDQSVAGQLVEQGVLSQEDADAQGHGNILLQALGVGDDVQVVMSHVELRRGDMVLVCSDGLSGMLAPSAIRKAMAGGAPAKMVCGRLVDEANAAGGQDNITCIVARFDGRGLHRPTAPDSVVYRPYVDMDLGDRG